MWRWCQRLFCSKGCRLWNLLIWSWSVDCCSLHIRRARYSLRSGSYQGGTLCVGDVLQCFEVHGSLLNRRVLVSDAVVLGGNQHFRWPSEKTWTSAKIRKTFQFFVIDFFLITVVALFIGRTGAAKILNPNPPPNRLATLAFYFSIFGQLILNIIFQVVEQNNCISSFYWFQVVPFLLVRAQSWYVPAPEHADGHKTMIGTTVFMASCCMYLGYAFVYSKPHPYRLPVYTNYWLCSVVLVLFCVSNKFHSHQWHIISSWTWLWFSQISGCCLS